MMINKTAAAAALLVLSIAAGSLLSGCAGGEIQVSSASSPPIDTDTASGVTEGAAKNPITSAAVSGENGPEPAPAPAPTPAPPPPPPAPQQTPAGEEGDDSYFDDALFIGDSLTEGFQLHGGITNATYYGFKNLNVKDVFEKPLVKWGSGKITIADAILKQSFEKYYIMLGANELGWVYPEVFTKKYAELIDLIRRENPEAKIYLQSVLPVTAEVSANSKVYSNDRINYYDELIAKLAEEKATVFLNVREAVQNSEGILPDGAAVDGVHLNAEHCKKWADYLRSNK